MWIALSRAFAALEAVAREHAAEHDLSPAEFGVLEALEHGGPMRLCDLRARLLVSSGGMTFLVDRLEERGLVERRPDPDDRRARLVHLTGEGTALIRSIFPEHARRIDRVLAGLDREGRREAIRLLKAVRAGAERTREKGRPAPEEEG